MTETDYSTYEAYRTGTLAQCHEPMAEARWLELKAEAEMTEAKMKVMQASEVYDGEGK